MRRCTLIGVAVGAGLSAGLAVPLSAQRLDEAVDTARVEWLGHRMDDLVSRSDTVRLSLPGIAPSASLQPGQAARLLSQYLKPSHERGFELLELRRLAPDHAYAEMVRTYVVKGTDEERQETVFLGFRLLEGAWRLREVRATP